MKKNSFWDVIVPRVLSTYAFFSFVVFWVGFFVILFTNGALFNTIWLWVQNFPAFLRLVVWVVFLPVMTGLWIWLSSWPTPVMLLAAAGMVGWTLLALSAFLRAKRSVES